MARFFKKRTAMLGKRPGEMVYIGQDRMEQAEIREIRFNSEDLEDQTGLSLLKGHKTANPSWTSWININGLGDGEMMMQLQEHFLLHPLTMADIMNTGLRPKLEEMENGFFLALKMLRFHEEEEIILSEQLSLITMGCTVLTFQEVPGDVFDPVRKRLAGKIGKIRNKSAVYLAYSLIDCVVDNYIAVMQILADKIEAVEEDLLDKPDEKTLETILSRKKELLFLSKSIRPARDAIKSLMKEGNPLLPKDQIPYFNDLLSNITQVTETIDLYKEICSEQLNSYNSTINNRLNEIMKFLTIFSVMFLPLSLVTGIYGTNFDFIPELHLPYGYAYMWGLLLLLAGGMILLFKRRKWF